MKKELRIIPFIELQKYFFILSFLVLFSGLFAYFVHKGFYYGIDFSGGIQLIIDLKKTNRLNQLKKELRSDIYILNLGKDNKKFIFKFVIDSRNFDVEALKKELMQTLSMAMPIDKDKINISYSINSGFLIEILLKDSLVTSKTIVNELNQLFNKKKLLDTSQLNKITYKLGLSELLSYIWILKPLQKNYPDLEILEENMYEPNQGKVLAQQSWMIITFVFILILIYIGLRFEFKYAIAAILSLIHDACIIIALAALFSKEIDSLLIISILTIIGYSLNDTIVIFDRIRENYQNDDVKLSEYIYQINKSITQCLKRTLITSLTTFFVVFSILIFGGAHLHNLAFGLSIGIISGTYSSIFIASPFLVLWEKLKSLRAQSVSNTN